MPVTLQPSGMKYKNGSAFQNADCLKGDKGDPGVYYGTTAPTDPDVTVWIDPNGTPITTVNDVQVNGTSIVNNGVATIPVSNGGVNGTPGLIGIINYEAGLYITNNGRLSVAVADSSYIKAGANGFRSLVPSKQHESVFYGLAKAAGEDMASSSNAVGTYTEAAKGAIRNMLGVESTTSLVETVSGTTPTIVGQPNVRYVCGSVTLIDITPPAAGTIDVIFESGSTAAVMTVPNTVKFPTWFDATSLEANTVYEIMITDGVYGAVMSWAS